MMLVVMQRSEEEVKEEEIDGTNRGGRCNITIESQNFQVPENSVTNNPS